MAFTVAAISISWFLYLLFHSYSASTSFYKRLLLFDETTPFLAYLQRLIEGDTPSLAQKLREMAEDPETFSSHTVSGKEDIQLLVKDELREVSLFVSGEENIFTVHGWRLVLQPREGKPRLIFWFLTPEEDRSRE